MTTEQVLADRAAAGFTAAYGRAPELIAFAPGRVNLIGEHTDYNNGFVLPCAIPYGTAIALGRSAADEIRAIALDQDGASDRFALDQDLAPLGAGHWANHIRGIVAGMPEFGLARGGADLAITGDVPQGAGLSSSASLGVALALGLAALNGQPEPDRTQLARTAQWSEHHFVGCQCGMMDQLASARGEQGQALLIDCRSNTCTPVPMPPDARIMIVHSGVQRGLVESAYNQRREQCMAAARHYGVAALRDLDAARLNRDAAGLEGTAIRRARHVVTENDRTLAMAAALARADYAAMSELMAASHRSMRDDFAITLPEIDALVETMANSIGTSGGARMTGGGFGGCVVAVIADSSRDPLESALAAHWAKLGRVSPLQTIVAPAQGARLL
jgi:galactokinase